MESSQSWPSRRCNGAVRAVKYRRRVATFKRSQASVTTHKSQPSDVLLKACARGEGEMIDGEMEYQGSGAMHGDDCGVRTCSRHQMTVMIELIVNPSQFNIE